MKTAYETKPNSGSMFANDRKQTDNHPDRKGKALIGGVWYWVSGWDKQGHKGPWLSLSFQEMTPEQVQQYCGGNQQQTPPPARRPAPPPRQPEPGYDSGPPTGTYQANRAASKAPAAPAPSEYPDTFTEPEIPF